MSRLISIAEIMEVVAAALALDVREIRQDCKAPHLAKARHLVFWLARRLGDHSYPEIGRFISRVPQHHSTVMQGERTIIARMESDPALAQLGETLLRTLEMLAARNLLRASAMADPVAVARRVVRNPTHHGVRVSTLETLALCQLVVDLYGQDDEPLPPLPTAATFTQPEEELLHG